MTNNNIMPVGMGELKLGSDKVLAVYGLGSCVALAIFDPTRGQGAMCHIVLPQTTNSNDGKQVGRYANTAVKHCVDQLVKEGSSRTNIRAKIAGGANLFPVSGQVAFLDIGPKNVKAVKKSLAEASVTLVGADVGGNRGRTVIFHPSDGKLEIRRTGEKTIVL